jgi:hypothetical protein
MNLEKHQRSFYMNQYREPLIEVETVKFMIKFDWSQGINHIINITKLFPIVCTRKIREDDIENYLTYAFHENKLLKLVDFLCNPRSFSDKTRTGVNQVSFHKLSLFASLRRS